jgi:hypothetical protein
VRFWSGGLELAVCHPGHAALDAASSIEPVFIGLPFGMNKPFRVSGGFPLLVAPLDLQRVDKLHHTLLFLR